MGARGPDQVETARRGLSQASDPRFRQSPIEMAISVRLRTPFCRARKFRAAPHTAAAVAAPRVGLIVDNYPAPDRACVSQHGGLAIARETDLQNTPIREVEEKRPERSLPLAIEAIPLLAP